MKIIILSAILFATAYAGGRDYDDDYLGDYGYQAAGWRNLRGALLVVRGWCYIYGGGYQYPSTTEAMGQLFSAGEVTAVEADGKNGESALTAGIQGAQDPTAADGMISKMDVSTGDGATVGRARRNSTSSYRGQRSYGSNNYFTDWFFVRQLRGTCDELRSVWLYHLSIDRPYTVPLTAEAQIWYNPAYGGHYNGVARNAGYGGMYRRSYGYMDYVVPRNKNAILSVTYTVYFCKKAPYVTTLGGYGGAGYGDGGKYRRHSPSPPRCNEGEYLDYETYTISVDSYERYGHFFWCSFWATSYCAENGYAGAALPPSMKYAVVPLGPDYKNNYDNTYGAEGAYSGGSKYRRSHRRSLYRY